MPEFKATSQFIQENIKSVEPYGTGNINDTYLVQAETQKLILQRLNTKIFENPEFVSNNIKAYSEHLKSKLNGSYKKEWLVPEPLLTQNGQEYFIDGEDYWRAFKFIDNARTYEDVQSLKHASEVGAALGKFHSLLSDLPVDSLYDSLPIFHIAPKYLAAYDKALASFKGDKEELAEYIDIVEQHRELFYLLEDAKDSGKLKMRVIHGDPKPSNVMISDDDFKAIAFVDLDTLKPGLIHYDIGDCLRSNCNPVGENGDPSKVVFDLDLMRGVLAGYLPQVENFLTELDYDYIYDSVCLITLEMAIRFFADYLAGNVYFKVKHARHNLDRAIVQFELLKSIEAQEKEIKDIILELR